MQKCLKYILVALMAVSCNKENADTPGLDGGGKVPLTVSAILDASAPATKAVNMQFDETDTFVAYLRHVTWAGGAAERVNVPADQAPCLVTFTKGNAAMEAYDGGEITPIGTGVPLGLTSSNTQRTADLVASPLLYWDNFTSSASADTDIRTANHYLESYYGYCYNGGTPTTDLSAADGTLGWTVAADQTGGIKTSDLLWSAEQTPVPYAHVDGEGKKNHGTLVLPFTHAMSKVTIELVLADGFDVDGSGKALAFGSNPTTPILYANRVTALTAPTYTQSTTIASGDASKIQMFLADNEATTNKVRVYEALIAPTVMKAGQRLASVTVDGNNYDLMLTDAVLNPNWSSKLKAYTVASTTLTKNSPEAAYTAENGGITLPGVNYRMRVTLRKQKIEVEAYIKNWEDVTASTDATIMFQADVVSSEVGGATPVTSTSFDLWRSTTDEDAASYDADGSVDGIQKASTYTYDTDKWVGSPEIYWQNASTSYYFRALAQVADPAGAPNVITTVDGSTQATQGLDLLWGQTSAHTGKGTDPEDPGRVYEAGEAINPRTGNVPLTFVHAMSKVSFVLKNADGITSDQEVTLTGATLKFVNLYDKGTINISTGAIESLQDDPDVSQTGTVDGEFKWQNTIVIPQSLVKDNADNDRDTAPVLYYPGDLTPIYDNNSQSNGTGSFKYYKTGELVWVPPVLYGEEGAKTHNAALYGAVSTESVKIPAKTKNDFGFDAFNADKLFAGISEDVYNSLPVQAKYETYTYEEYIALDAASFRVDMFNALPVEMRYKPAELYTEEDVNRYKEEHPEEEPDFHAGDPKPREEYSFDGFVAIEKYKSFTRSEFETLYASHIAAITVKPIDQFSYTEYTTTRESVTQVMYNAFPADVVLVPAVNYTEEEAVAFNATLDGAVSATDVQTPGFYKLPDDPSGVEPVNIGDVKSQGNKIMLYITLADGTIYSVDIAQCREQEHNTFIQEWQRNKHYTYTISLQKEQISFQALIRDWEEVNAGGNAELEW